MTTFILSFVALLLAVAAMAIGVMMGRRPIAGSCGGLAGGACAGCTRVCRRGRDQEDDEEERP